METTKLEIAKNLKVALEKAYSTLQDINIDIQTYEEIEVAGESRVDSIGSALQDAWNGAEDSMWKADALIDEIEKEAKAEAEALAKALAEAKAERQAFDDAAKAERDAEADRLIAKAEAERDCEVMEVHLDDGQITLTLEYTTAQAKLFDDALHSLMDESGESLTSDQVNAVHDLWAGLTVGILPEAVENDIDKPKADTVLKLGTESRIIPLIAPEAEWEDETDEKIEAQIEEYHTKAEQVPEIGELSESSVKHLVLEQALYDAGIEFWRSIADSYPGIKTGDMSPRETELFEDACESAVRAWVRNNVES